MRIVISSISFCEYVIQQANGLAGLGHHVLVVMPSSLVKNTVGADIGGLCHPGVECFAYTEERPWKWAYYTDIIRTVSSFSPDVLHFHENGEPGTLALLLRYINKPLVISIHDVTTHPGADTRLKTRRRLIKRLLKMRADVIHLHGETLRDKFNTLYPGLSGRVSVIPHGSLTIFKCWEKEIIKHEPRTVLFFGRMEKYRGLDNLLKIGRILRETVPGIKIIVAGRGSELERYKEEMTNLGIFEIHDGFIPDKDVFRYFRRASLLLLPYHEASQSGVVAMGFPFGVPVVATRVGSIPEVVIDGRHGRIVSPGDVAGFAGAVRDLLADGGRLKRMSDCCLETAEKLDFNVISPEFVRLYIKAIAGEKSVYQEDRCVSKS
ncbi:MAG: hypothetical protein A2W28_04495 [Gammaproteobacteria bacterium RBG_16_51_14]|nr:MAG: hypothetical protein A2W28_04495 [Gammaproteobacteria bacterium RBG_16_51_14]